MEKQYFFSREFDAKWLLSDEATENLESNCYAKCFDSIDEFESNIIQVNSQLSSDLRALDLAETQKKTKPVSGKKREQRLKELCMRKALVEGTSMKNLCEEKSAKLAEPASAINLSCSTATYNIRHVLERYKKKTPKNDVLSKMKTTNGPLAKLREWVHSRHRVRIVLRGRGSPNAIITAVVIAFDKHWNLVLRDGTELFLPPAKVSREITKVGLNAFEPRYRRTSSLQSETFLGYTGESRKAYTRHLICSMIRGENIVLIQQA